MHICVTTTTIPRDNSSTESEVKSNKDSVSISSDSTITNQLNQDFSHNPYQQPPSNTMPTSQIMNTLKSWIIPTQIQMPQPTSTHNHTPILGNVTLILAPNATPRHFQATLPVLTNNEHWGDNLMNPKPLDMFHVLSKNINTLSTKTKYISWKSSIPTQSQ